MLLPTDRADDVRFAVHILAHTEPDLFAGLVDSLRHERIDVYAHLDRTAVAAPFRAATSGYDVRFVPDRDRVNVHWGGLSQVRATMRLTDLALSSGERYHRHSLLSGMDVRVAPLGDVLARWSGGDEFLRLDGEIFPGRAGLVRRFHFPDQPRIDPAARRITARLRRRVPATVRLVRGSQWWSLTGGAVAWVRGELRREPRWARFFRFSHCPDEYVIQSLVAASPFAPAITQDYSRCDQPPGTDLHGQHYIRWLPGGLRPEPFTRAELPTAQAAGALFARKVTGECPWRPE